jgi:hypothetical protein
MGKTPKVDAATTAPATDTSPAIEAIEAHKSRLRQCLVALPLGSMEADGEVHDYLEFQGQLLAILGRGRKQ